MTIFKVKNIDHAFVWIWLPGKTEPIVAGRITKENQLTVFNYGKSYLENPEAIALSPFELPLRSGNVFPEGMNTIHSCLRDAAPDAWGRRVIEYQYSHLNPGELDYMLLSGSDRIGALDFQVSSSEYCARESKRATLEDLLQVTSCVAQNQPIPPELEYALLRGTSVGGARPKALIQDDKKYFIAKFSLNTDIFNIIKAEYVGMRLAKCVGINVPEVTLRDTLGKDILLIERFDRDRLRSKTVRHLMLSGLSLLKLNELEARYASYCDLASCIRQNFKNPTDELRELYKRLIFNVLIGNTDDHARNHSAFWDGETLCLTPAYDLCPQARIGQEATQAMAIEGAEGNFSTLVNIQSISEHFQITKKNASELINYMIDTVENHWAAVCEEANLSVVERSRLWKNSIFNPFCFRGWGFPN
jgi:serine/threonine-protein kinase HipA